MRVRPSFSYCMTCFSSQMGCVSYAGGLCLAFLANELIRKGQVLLLKRLVRVVKHGIALPKASSAFCFLFVLAIAYFTLPAELI